MWGTSCGWPKKKSLQFQVSQVVCEQNWSITGKELSFEKPAVVKSHFEAGLSGFRSAASACRQGARPRLHHRAETDGRPVWQHHRRPLQGAEGESSERPALVCYLHRSQAGIHTRTRTHSANSLTKHFPNHQFRLKRCGLRRPIYLVEECGSAASHLSLPESTLQQAIVNTQVGSLEIISMLSWAK